MSNIFGFPLSAEQTLSPTLINYLNSVAPYTQDGLTRKQELIEYWKTIKVLPSSNVKTTTQEKLAANGSAHHFYDETIKLLNKRIRMLYDLKGVIGQNDRDLCELLRAIN